MTRRTRLVGTIVLTAAAVAYLLWKVDLAATLDVLEEAELAWFALAVAIMAFTVPGLASPFARDRRTAPMADADVLRRVHGGAVPADVARRGRGADHGDVPSAPRANPRRDRDGGARARARWSRHRPSRGRRLPPLDQPLRRERLSLARGRVCLRNAGTCVPVLRALGAAAAPASRTPSRARSTCQAAAGLLREHSPLSRTAARSPRGVGRDARVQAVRILSIWPPPRS